MADNRGVNKSAEARVVCTAPDVCWTPMGSSMVTVAYNIESCFHVAEKTAKNVNFGGQPVFTMGSHLPTVTGDEKGIGGGIISGVYLGCCKPIPKNHSTTVRIENEWLVRHGDAMEMNCNGPNGKGNTFGIIVYIGVTPGAYVNAEGEIVFTKEESIADSQTGETGHRKTEIKRDPETGEITQTQETTITDSKSGETIVRKVEVTQDPLTGEVTSATQQDTFFDHKTGNIETTFTTPDAGSMDFINDQHPVGQTGGITLGQGGFNTGASLGNSGPVLGNEAIGTQDAYGRTYLGDGIYASPGAPSKGLQPPLAEPDAPFEIPDDDPELLNHPEYRDAIEAEQAALREIERINKELAWEATKTVVDLAGLIDPTPTSDLVGAGMAIKEGDFLGAGLNLVSVFPYLGDALAKPIKGVRTAKKVAELTQTLSKLTAKLDKLKDAKQKAVNRIKEALRRRRVPEARRPGRTPDAPNPKKDAAGAGAGDGGHVPEGKLKGETIQLKGMKKKKIEYKKRAKAEKEKLRGEFDKTEKEKFLKDLGNDPDKVKQLREHGLSDTQINKLRNGEGLEGFQVHHKLPLDDNGTNAFDNLILIKNDPYHKTLTNLQNDLIRGMSPGDTRVIDWPTPNGFVYP